MGFSNNDKLKIKSRDMGMKFYFIECLLWVTSIVFELIVLQIKIHREVKPLIIN